MFLADLLKHDKMLSKKAPAQHLRDMPDYLVDKPTQEASKFVKLSAAAMGNTNASRGKGSKGRFKRSRDPLKTFSAEVIPPKPLLALAVCVGDFTFMFYFLLLS